MSRLERDPGEAIWLCGGAQLASTLFSEGLVNQIVVKLNPVFGGGIPMLGAGIDPTRLGLQDRFVHPSGHVPLRYRIDKRT